jgi:uncharacterized protein with HEPN domain
MPRDDLVYVGHMLDTARLAVAKVVGVTREVFDEDENLRLALTHLVQTIGEAARQVSPAFHQAYPHIPWAKIVGMRHRVVHGYLHVDYDIVWGVVSVDLPPLIEGLAGIVAPEEDLE